MSARADYNDGRDWLTGEPVTLLPPIDQIIAANAPRIEDRIAVQAEQILAAEGRQERHRGAVLDAAIGALEEIIADAEQGYFPDRAIQAASADLVIRHLGAQLRAARELIPAHADPAALIRIDTALAAAGLA